MIYPELKDAPSIISIQADDSNRYPTALGTLISGISYQWFISPDEKWLADGFSVAKQRHLTTDFLMKNGQSASDVSTQLLARVPVYKVFISMDAERDIALLKMLHLEMLGMINVQSRQDVIDADFAIGIADIRNVVELTSLCRLIDEQKASICEHRLNPKHAADVSVATGFALQRLFAID